MWDSNSAHPGKSQRRYQLSHGDYSLFQKEILYKLPNPSYERFHPIWQVKQRWARGFDPARSQFFLLCPKTGKKFCLGVILCGESIARIHEA